MAESLCDTDRDMTAAPPDRVSSRPAMTTRQRWTLICTVIGSGVVFLDGTIVNAALKHIGQELPGTIIGVLEGQAYIVGGYLAVLAALLILSGALSDHYGRRKVYAIGLVGFAATSALCGLAPTLEWLVVFRLAQGAAGALLIPGSLALITHAFDGVARARAFGIWAAATAALTILGPIIGGTIVDTVGWRVAFLVNVPLLAFALWATISHVAESRDTESTGRFDWLGRRRRGAGRRRPRVRGHPRPGQRMGGHRRLDRDRDRRRRPRRLPDPDGPPAAPARSARALPVARVRARSTSRRSSSTAACT